MRAKPELDRAVKLMQESLTALQLGGARAYSAETLYLEALGLRGQGLAEKAMEVMQEARTEAEALESRRVLWQIYAALSELSRERGTIEQADAYRNQAREILAYILAHLPLEYHESFLNLPRVREVMMELPGGEAFP